MSAPLPPQPDSYGDLAIEIEGEGVTPATIDARTALELASAYFDLLVRISKQRGDEVQLTGLRVYNKCLAIATAPSSMDGAADAAREAQDYLSGRDEPTGLTNAVRRVREARKQLPLGHRAKVIVGPWTNEIPLRVEQPTLPPYETLQVRATPIRVGGTRPRVRFRSDSEVEEFTLDASESQARELGAQLYREVEITASVSRDEHDCIRIGRLSEVVAIDSEPGEVREVFRAWLLANAPRWEEIDDIESELRSGLDDDSQVSERNTKERESKRD